MRALITYTPSTHSVLQGKHAQKITNLQAHVCSMRDCVLIKSFFCMSVRPSMCSIVVPVFVQSRLQDVGTAKQRRCDPEPRQLTLLQYCAWLSSELALNTEDHELSSKQVVCLSLNILISICFTVTVCLQNHLTAPQWPCDASL